MAGSSQQPGSLVPELADVVGLAEAGLAPDLLAESLRGAALELADGSPAVNVLACATVLRGARRLRVPHGGSRCCLDG